MRRLLFALLPLLAVLALACGRGESDLRPCPTPSDAAAAFVPPPTPGPASASDVSTAVWDGARLLEDNYVDEISRTKLLEAAWDSTAKELHSRGITIPPEIDPNRAKATNTRDREAQLRTAFEKLASSLDSSKLSNRQLIDIALGEMADSLNDGHTAYIPSFAWDDAQQNRVTSLGFRTRSYSGGYVVVDVLPGSSADTGGIKRGDVVTALNGQALAGGAGSLAPIAPGAVASVTFTRQGGAPQTVELQLKPVALPPVRAELIGGQIGLLQMYSFPSRQGCDYISAFRDSFDSSIADLKSRGAKAWVLDLRNNPGGATAIASFVAGSLGYDGLLLRISRRSGYWDHLETTGNSQIDNAPLAILVNERSASSSEIVAASMGDARRAYVVGNKTAGEVAASARFPLAGGGMAITVGRVEAGTFHRILENTGVTPDLKVDLDLPFLADQAQDSQLNAAIDYVKSKLR